MNTQLLKSVGEIAADAWDALSGASDPFAEHAFLLCLEDSGTVGPGSGWTPLHVTAWDDARLVGALPLYVKEHSYGEYIFDWAWAEASMRVGLPYYPKLVSMIPVTPVTGTRFLVAEDVDYDRVTSQLLAGCLEAAEQTKSSSVHLLFLTEKEQLAVQNHPEYMHRLSMQFHWTNRDFSSFEDYLSNFRASARKNVLRERKKAAASDLSLEVVDGAELNPSDWGLLRFFYQSTCARYGSHPYLTSEFFELLPERLAHRVVVALARSSDGVPVAASLNFEKGRHLYGRYWGALEDFDSLHFELCYYRLIERAIARGVKRFEAGAQGHHKLKRGLLPVPIYSCHWIRHPLLSNAVAEFLMRERLAVLDRIRCLEPQGPFHRTHMER